MKAFQNGGDLEGMGAQIGRGDSGSHDIHIGLQHAEASFSVLLLCYERNSMPMYNFKDSINSRPPCLSGMSG